MPVIAPIIAVAASGFAISTAVAGGVLFSFATLAAVSSVVGAVGVITKNKTLMTIGAVGALVGGVGMWAQSTGAFGGTAATKAAGTASGAASKEAVSSIVKGMDASSASASVGTQVASAAAPGVLDEVAVTASRVAAPATLGRTIPTAAQLDATRRTLDGIEQTSAEKLADKRLKAIETAEADARGENGYLKQFASFAKDNGQLLVLGGSTLSSLFEQPAEGSAEKTRAETAALEQQTAEKNIQLANMQAPLARFAPAAVPGYRGVDPNTGRPVQYATRTAADPGLINTITGAPV
jgi:hypothetical protein